MKFGFKEYFLKNPFYHSKSKNTITNASDLFEKIKEKRTFQAPFQAKTVRMKNGHIQLLQFKLLLVHCLASKSPRNLGLNWLVSGSFGDLFQFI